MQSASVKTFSSGKSRKAMKAESVMKAQVWVSGISTASPVTSNTDCVSYAHHSQSTTSRSTGDTQTLEPAVHPQRTHLLSAANPKTHALATTLPLPSRILSSSDKLAEGIATNGVLNQVNSSISVSYSTNNVTLATPMKRVDSISASARLTKTSTGIACAEKSALSSHRSHFEGVSGSNTRRINDVAGAAYLTQSDHHFGHLAHVQSVPHYQGSETSKQHETVPVSCENIQRAAALAGVDGSSSASVENSVGGRGSAKTGSGSQTRAVVVSNSAAEECAVADENADQNGVAGGSLSAQKNARLSELWSRFSLDSTVCSPCVTDSDIAGNVQRPLGSATNSTSLQSVSEHHELSIVKHPFATEKSEKQQSLSAHSVTNNSRLHAVRDNSSSISDQSVLLATDRPNTVHVASANMNNEPKSEELSKSDDAERVSVLPANIAARRAYIVRDDALPAVPEDTTLDSVTSDFASSGSFDDLQNVITRTTKHHIPNDPKLIRLQQKIAQQREKHEKVRRNEQRRKEHINKMELALRERQKSLDRETRSWKKTENHRMSEMAASDATMTTVASNDSDTTLQCSSLQASDSLSADNLQLVPSHDTTRSCSCLRDRRIQKTEDVLLWKQHQSESSFKPKLHEVKYVESKATRSAPTILSRETFSHEQDRKVVAKNVRRKMSSSVASRRLCIPKTEELKNAQGDRRTPSKTSKPSQINKSAAKASLSKAHYSSRILTEKNENVPKERGVRSKAVQTTPRLKDRRALYASTAVQCPAVSSRFDELGVVSLPVMSRSQHLKSVSSVVYSANSSSDAELLHCLKYQSLVKQPSRVSVLREF